MLCDTMVWIVGTNMPWHDQPLTPTLRPYLGIGPREICKFKFMHLWQLRYAMYHKQECKHQWTCKLNRAMRSEQNGDGITEGYGTRKEPVSSLIRGSPMRMGKMDKS